MGQQVTGLRSRLRGHGSVWKRGQRIAERREYLAVRRSQRNGGSRREARASQTHLLHVMLRWPKAVGVVCVPFTTTQTSPQPSIELDNNQTRYCVAACLFDVRDAAWLLFVHSPAALTTSNSITNGHGKRVVSAHGSRAYSPVFSANSHSVLTSAHGQPSLQV
jgi:hypothetical protein